MSKQKQKQRKEKKRKEQAKSRILKRRKELREMTAKHREEDKKRRDAQKGVTYVKENHPLGGLVVPNKDSEEKVQERLESHKEQVDELYNEITRDDEIRQRINEHFDSQGITDMKSKMEHLQEMARVKQQQSMQQKKKGMKGSAQVKFTPNEE